MVSDVASSDEDAGPRRRPEVEKAGCPDWFLSGLRHPHLTFSGRLGASQMPSTVRQVFWLRPKLLTHQWCPGAPVLKNMPTWDRSKCHPWYFDKNSPVTNSTIIEGFPPPRPPQPPCVPFVNCLPGL